METDSLVNLQTTTSGLFRRLTAGLVDRRARGRFGQYLFQCGLGTLSLLFILIIEDALLHAAIVVAIGSTVFIVFIVPDSVAATPRRVIGGHVVSVIFGSAFAFMLMVPGLETLADGEDYVRVFAAALAVGISMLVMVLTNTEHPPAAGTALGLFFPGWELSTIVFIVLSAVVLSAIRILLRPRMINLL